MKAIEILRDKKRSRHVDRVEDSLRPGNMPWMVVRQFVKWLWPLVKKHGDANGYWSIIASGAIGRMWDESYRATRMLTLLHVETVGFGKQGRRARKAQCKELLRMCKVYEQENAPKVRGKRLGIMGKV